ncbi:MAG: V-type ATP synthase subunit I [Candidatus Jordarchaeum sp.]|uniref:V-type ATP synthase subunit I n=1 Tax=Candidatus Jordarchaeum sp. TaxID=2823881 RepID=UPI00404A5FA1
MKLTPAKLGIIKIICHRDYERPLINCLHELGEIELIDVEESGGTVVSLSDEERSALQLLNEVNRNIESLNLSQYIPYIERLPKEKKWSIDDRDLKIVLKMVEKTLEEAGPKVEALGREISEVEQELDQQRTLLKIAETLKPLDIKLSQIGPGRYVYAEVGTVQTVKTATMRWRIREVTEGNYVLHAVSIGEGRDAVFVAVLNQYRGVVERILNAFGFERFKIPFEVKGATEDIIQRTGKNIEKLEASRQKLEEKKMEITKKLGIPLLVAKEQLEIEKERIDAKRFLRVTKATVEVWGWIPLERVQSVRRIIEKVTDDTAIIEVSLPDFPEEEFPTKMENPKKLTVYEGLVKSFGIPKYTEIDPTKLIVFTFPLFFGMMFPDVAHGGLLALIAGLVLLWKRRKPVITGMLKYLLDGAGLLFICGISAVIFGFLFGSVFGSHHVIDPLWYNPFPADPSMAASANFKFLRLAIIIGVVEISLGLILKFRNLWREKKRKMAFFQPLCLLWLYIGAFLIIFSEEFGVMFMNWFSPTGGINFTVLATLFQSPGSLTLFDYLTILQNSNITSMWYITIKPLKVLEPLTLGGYFIDTGWWHTLELIAQINYIQGEHLLHELLANIQTILIYSTKSNWPVFHLPPANLIFYTSVISPAIVSLVGTIGVSHEKSEGFSEGLDYLISLLSHSVSFARIFALAAVHLVLSEIFLELPGPPALANVYQVIEYTFPGGSIPRIEVFAESLLWAAVGTIFIMLLEGLVSFLNSLRLHWVEFFSKFYVTGGRECAPFASHRQVTRLEENYEEMILEKEIAVKSVRSSGFRSRFKRKGSS